jgi:tetratricopeptide (TPR) repeat protein
MKTTKNYIFAVLITLMSVSGCAAFQVGTDVEAGRKAFLIGDNEAALGYFRSAAQMNPDYVYYGMGLRQNVWSYVGRSEYAAGRLAQARQTLEKALVTSGEEYALSLDGGQDMARLYLGLTLARSGDQQRGLKEIEGGMRGIHDGIEYVRQRFRFSFGRYWDPSREIRSSIEGDLAMLSGKNVDVQKLIGDGEWLGKTVEEEINLARRDERENLLGEHD